MTAFSGWSRMTVPPCRRATASASSAIGNARSEPWIDFDHGEGRQDPGELGRVTFVAGPLDRALPQ